ncbi:MAG: pantoate--beta-alanine ligase [Deltaproteobacteria bacterium]|nr:pantoate--beta-alanine ligase [Deltaproteobacteria bacterium]
MQQIENSTEIQAFALESRRTGKSIALVPTMGYLHDGHLMLMRKAREKADLVIVSIFVNPIQFGPNEDLDRYPQDLEGDLAKCKTLGVDVVFTPTNEDLYPDLFQTSVEVKEITKDLCGAGRPNHFQGVTTVVSKLFNLTLPNLAFFGEKDFQQLAVIRRMVIDLNFPIEIVGVEIVRERNGLAMSSRNANLPAREREEAPSIYQALSHAKTLYQQGLKESEKLCQTVSKQLEEKISSPFRVEYVKIYDALKLTEIKGRITTPTVLLIAVHLGGTRLIDNLQLEN